MTTVKKNKSNKSLIYKNCGESPELLATVADEKRHQKLGQLVPFKRSLSDIQPIEFMEDDIKIRNENVVAIKIQKNEPD